MWYDIRTDGSSESDKKKQMDGYSGYRRIDNKEHNVKTTNHTPAMEICSVDFPTQTLNNLHAKTVELGHGLDRCLSSCLDQELRLQLLERATYNGVLLWKIDDFARRRKEAVDGVTMSLYSIPFYTNRHGYKMCARVYLNGDGMGKGTHLSFFFVVMKGPFDALLPWPFKQKVTVAIINQAGKKHVTETFRPDPIQLISEANSKGDECSIRMSIVHSSRTAVKRRIFKRGLYIFEDYSRHC